MRRVTGKILLGLAATSAAITAATSAFADDICYDLLEPLWGPPTFEEATVCRQKSIGYCIALPHCCSPLCKTDPVCTITTEVFENDGKTVCDITLEEALDRWMSGMIQFTDPTNVLPLFDLLAAQGQPRAHAPRTTGRFSNTPRIRSVHL